MLRSDTISRLQRYYFDNPLYKRELVRSTQEFFDEPNFQYGGFVRGPEESIGFYNEWFMYDFVLRDGESVLSHFVHVNPLALSPEELGVYQDLLDNRFGLFEILSVVPLRSMELRLLTTGEIFTVVEYAATMDAKEGWGLFGRVSRVGDHYEMVGADSFTVPLRDPEFKPYLDKVLAKGKLTPKDVLLMLTTGDVQ